MGKSKSRMIQLRRIVDALGAYNTTDSVDILRAASGRGVLLPSAKVSFGYGADFICGPNFAGGLTIAALVRSYDGDVYCMTSWAAGASGQDYDAHFGGEGFSAVALTFNVQQIIQTATVSDAAVGDVVRGWFRRDATNIADTISAAVELCALIFTWYEYS